MNKFPNENFVDTPEKVHDEFPNYLERFEKENPQLIKRDKKKKDKKKEKGT